MVSGHATTIAVIPARYASTRFPGKLLRPLHGRSILAHVHERALEVAGLDRVIVATDDPRIAEEVRRFGGEVRMTKAEHPSGTDRIGEVLAGLDPAPDFVLNLQGDEPVLAPRSVESLLGALHGQPDAVWTPAATIDDPDERDRTSVVKVVRAADGRALYFSRAAVPFDHAGSGSSALRHIGIYAYPVALLRSFLAAPRSRLERIEGLEQLRALEQGIPIRVMVGAWPEAGVDTPEDLERLLARYPTAEALARAGREGGSGGDGFPGGRTSNQPQ